MAWITSWSASDLRIKHGWVRVAVCVCVFFLLFFTFILDVRLFVDVPAGVAQEEGHTGFLIHLPSAVLALIFIARRFHSFFASSTVKSNVVL